MWHSNSYSNSYSISNSPLKMFYFAFGAEILWTACVTSIYVPFCKISENMISRMFKQGVHLNFFRNALTKINGRIHWGSLITLQKSLLTLLLNHVGSFLDWESEIPIPRSCISWQPASWIAVKIKSLVSTKCKKLVQGISEHTPVIILN